MTRIGNWPSRERKGLTIIFLILAQAAVVFGYMLPVLEKTEYYRSKITELEGEYRTLQKMSLYADHHKKEFASMRGELKRLKEDWKRQTDYRRLQRRLGALQRENRLTAVSQRISRVPNAGNFPQQAVKQVLTGKYGDMMRYFDAILEEDASAIFAHISLTARNPASNDPIIRSEFELRYFDVPK